MAGLIKRGKNYYAVYYVGGKERRRALETDVYQIAKERLRKLEADLVRGGEDSFPTKTPVPDLVQAYIDHIRTVKTKNSCKVDCWYLRSIFGSVCPALEATGNRGKRRRRRAAAMEHVEASYVEDISTAMIAEFIDAKVRGGLGPKSANRYREILQRFFNWAMEQREIRMPGDRNPAAKVERRRQPASEIRFLTLEQIQVQLDVLEHESLLQTMVAVYIYAGLRREEALWLTLDDIDLAAGDYGMIRIRAKTVNKQRWEPKTKVNRAVPVSRALRAYLDRYTPRIVPGRWYFPSPKRKRWDPDNFSHRLSAANKKAKLPWSCLDYRHTFGSHLAMNGVSLYKISALMGNSPEICRRHYAALLPESLVDSVEFVGHDVRAEPPRPAGPQLRVISSKGRLVELS